MRRPACGAAGFGAVAAATPTFRGQLRHQVAAGGRGRGAGRGSLVGAQARYAAVRRQHRQHCGPGRPNRREQDGSPGRPARCAGHICSAQYHQHLQYRQRQPPGHAGNRCTRNTFRYNAPTRRGRCQGRDRPRCGRGGCAASRPPRACRYRCRTGIACPSQRIAAHRRRQARTHTSGASPRRGGTAPRCATPGAQRSPHAQRPAGLSSPLPLPLGLRFFDTGALPCPS